MISAVMKFGVHGGGGRGFTAAAVHVSVYLARASTYSRSLPGAVLYPGMVLCDVRLSCLCLLLWPWSAREPGREGDA